MDGSAKDNEIAIGGVVRNDKAEWIIGFTKFIGTGSLLLAKAWALQTGLQIAFDIGIENLEIEIDCQDLFSLMSDDISNLHPLSNIVLNYRFLISKFDNAKLLKIKRNQNLYSDKLAKHATTHGRSAKTFSVSSPFCSTKLYGGSI